METKNLVGNNSISKLKFLHKETGKYIVLQDLSSLEENIELQAVV